MDRPHREPFVLSLPPRLTQAFAKTPHAYLTEARLARAHAWTAALWAYRAQLRVQIHSASSFRGCL